MKQGAPRAGLKTAPNVPNKGARRGAKCASAAHEGGAPLDASPRRSRNDDAGPPMLTRGGSAGIDGGLSRDSRRVRKNRNAEAPHVVPGKLTKRKVANLPAAPRLLRALLWYANAHADPDFETPEHSACMRALRIRI